MAAAAHWLLCGVLMTAVTSSTAHTCSVKATDSGITVNCQNQGYSAIPDDLPTVNVTTLDFTGNKLSALTDYMFDSFSDLRKLVLMQNPIKSYTARAFAGLKRLVYLDLSMTLLTSINTSLCRDMSALRYLVIVYGYSLNSLSDDAFQGCNELHGVAIIGTLTLQTINKVFANLPELARLYLEDNENLQLTDPHAFDNSPQLVFLSLKGMGEQLSQLPKAVTSITSLQTLNVSNSRFTTFSTADTAFFDKLQVLEASGNPYTCTCDTTHFITWFQHTHVIADKTDYECSLCANCADSGLVKDYNTKTCGGVTLRDTCFACYVTLIVAAVVIPVAVIIALVVYIRRRRRRSGYSQM